MKILSIILIITVGFGTGFYIKKQYLTRQNTLDAYVKAFSTLLLHLKSETPSTSQLIKLIAEQDRFSVCAVFIDCHANLQIGQDFPTAFHSAIAKSKKISGLLPQDIGIIEELETILGFYEKQELISQLELTLYKLNEALQDAITQTTTQSKMYQTLASMGSIAIAIIIA